MAGVVEGFYGFPWDFHDRISMISFMSRVGLNLYFYAPKDDPYHRILWRNPYPSSLIEQFRELIDFSNRYSVNFAFAISPGLDIDYSSQSDVDILVRKLDTMMDLGVRYVGLFLDDIPPEIRGGGFRTLAEAQASLANKVFRELSPDKLFLVPTYYWGYEESYLRELSESVERDIEIVWTGRYVVSPEITIEDIERFREITGRSPAIWDNYPVNDYFIVRGVTRLHLGVIRGRSPEMMRRVSAYIANPMNQAEISKIPLYTIARLLSGYTPDERDLDKAVELIVNEEAQEAMKIFVRLNSSSVLNPDADQEINEVNARDILRSLDILNRDLRNRKMFSEIRPVVEFLRHVAREVGEGKRVQIVSNRIQAAGLYEPPISDEAMKRVFGRVVRRRPKWLQTG